MNTDFKNKYGDWALVTGATSGIGGEIASQLAAKGLNILLVARKEEDLTKQANFLQQRYGVEASYIPADLSTTEGVEKVKATKEKIGLLVLAAALEVNGAFEKTSHEKELQLIQINVVSTLQLTHQFSKGMVDRKKDGILMVASLAAHMSNPYFANYAGSKAYVLNFGASLHGELKPKGIDVSVISPGLTNTPMIANTGVDWSKTPMSAMEPAVVAEFALDGLGKRLLSVPGGKNKIMAFMAKHSPLQMQAGMNEKMMKSAIEASRL